MGKNIEYTPSRGINFTDIQEGKAKHSSIEELKSPTRILLKKLAPNINEGKYDILIVDDVSGRIPGLILYKVIGQIYKNKNYPTPKILFIPGGRKSDSTLEEHSSSISEHIAKVMNSHSQHKARHQDVHGEPDRDAEHSMSDKMKDILKSRISDEPNTEHKIMLVTETLATGSGIESMVNAIKKQNVDFDIVTIGLSGIGTTKIIERKFDKEVYFALPYPPKIYGQKGRKLAGLEKDRGDKFSTKNINSELDRVIVNEAREDVDTLVKGLVGWYMQNCYK